MGVEMEKITSPKKGLPFKVLEVHFFIQGGLQY